MELEIYQVDAFSTRPFSGNPAGVCITPQGLETTTMQQIAAEMAVSETAFLALDEYRLRWFTPEAEVDLCGHGTLATAHILRQTGLLAVGESVVFTTLSGPLKATAGPDTIELDFPLLVPDMQYVQDEALLDALGLDASDVSACGKFGPKVMMVVEDAEIIDALKPRFQALSALPGRGVAITAPGHGKYDFISRYFAPWVGVNEDPVTGSAHCALAAYWAARLDKRTLCAWQASPRGGELHIALTSAGRVALAGQSHTVLAGTFYL